METIKLVHKCEFINMNHSHNMRHKILCEHLLWGWKMSKITSFMIKNSQQIKYRIIVSQHINWKILENSITMLLHPMPYYSAKFSNFLLRSEARQACQSLTCLFNMALDSFSQLSEKIRYPQPQRESKSSLKAMKNLLKINKCIW